MLEDLDVARLQMALSLAFHIVFAAAGIALPALMAIAEYLWLKGHGDAWKRLAQGWAKTTAVLFAVGAVSGTVLSFELGLLWPRFMADTGAIIGIPFSLEAYAFFAEAIFLGVYLYGWERVPRWTHWWAGVAVAVAGALSGAFVVLVNAWMNAPTLTAQGTLATDAFAALRSPAGPHQVVHMTIAAYLATGVAVAGWHARKHGDVHRKAFALGAGMVVVMAPLAVWSGHWSAQEVHDEQPAKFAAMEAHFHSGPCAPLTLGGWPDEEANRTRWAIEVPCGLSILAANDPDANVTGLDAYAPDDRPPVAITHWAFDIMVAAGTWLLALAAWTVWAWRRSGLSDRLRRAWAWSLPVGFIAIEAGWTVTEVGRQPWIVHGFMRTEDAVTPVTGLVWPFIAIMVVYIGLSAMTIWWLRRPE